jgi:hypothetical protein
MTLVYTIGVLAICAAAAGHATPSPGPTSVTQARRAAQSSQAAQAAQATQAKPPPATQCGAWEKGVSLTGHDFAHSKTGSAAACCVRSTSPVHCYCCLCPPVLLRCQTFAQYISVCPLLHPT